MTFVAENALDLGSFRVAGHQVFFRQCKVVTGDSFRPSGRKSVLPLFGRWRPSPSTGLRVRKSVLACSPQLNNDCVHSALNHVPVMSSVARLKPLLYRPPGNSQRYQVEFRDYWHCKQVASCDRVQVLSRCPEAVKGHLLPKHQRKVSLTQAGRLALQDQRLAV